MSASNNSTTEEAAIRDRIRDVLAGLISAHTRLQSRVLKAMVVFQTWI